MENNFSLSFYREKIGVYSCVLFITTACEFVQEEGKRAEGYVDTFDGPFQVYTYRSMRLFHPICAHLYMLFTLFHRTLKGDIVPRRLINVPVHSLSSLFYSKSRFLSVHSFFFQFSSLPLLSRPRVHARARAVRFLPFRLSRGLFFLSSANVPAYIAGQRRINSQVLSDTIPRITASSVSFLAAARPGRVLLSLFRGDSRQGKEG